jgi:hypothetical protein
MHFWSIKSKQGNLSYIMENGYLRDKIVIQMNMRDKFTNLDWVNVAYSWENSFSPRDYINSLKENVSLKVTRHRMGSPLICASSIRITYEVHLNRFKSLEELILYLGQGMINLQQFEIMPRKHTTTKVDR